MPERTLPFKDDNCNGGKNSKNCLMDLFCTNADGSDKRTPIVIAAKANAKWNFKLSDKRRI